MPLSIGPGSFISGELAARRESVAPDLVVTAEEAGIEQKLPVRFLPMWFRASKRFSLFRARPLVGLHSCLEPWLTPGDVLWYDDTLEPQDRDIVVFECYYGTRIGERRYVKMLAVKQYRVIPSIGQPHRFLCSNQGCLEGDGVDAVGPLWPVTAWMRKAWWRKPPIRTMKFELPFAFFDRDPKTGRLVRIA